MTNFRVNVKVTTEGDRGGGGMRRIYERIRKIDTGAKRSRGAASLAMAVRVADEIVATVQGASGGGETWNEGHPKFVKRWQNSYERSSSTPGNPPRDQWGGLVDSVYTVKVSERSANVEVRAPYAVYHEFGDWTSFFGNSIGARPFIRPSLEKVSGELGTIAEAAFRNETGL
jgi:phage gpG-like protein